MNRCISTLDCAGRITLSEEQSRRTGLRPGDAILLRETADGLMIVPLDPPLGKVYVEPTTRCNLHCPMCVRQYWDEPAVDLPWKTYERLMAGLHEIKTCKRIAFWGFGEPLLHPDILRMIAAAHNLGIQTEIITNGFLLDDAMALGLLQAGLDTICFSIDGTSIKTVGHPSSTADVATVVKNIKRLHQMAAIHRRDLIRSDGCAMVIDEPEIGLEFVATRENIRELPRVRELARSVGANFVIVSNLLPYTAEMADQILYHKSTGRWTPSTRLERRADITVGRMDNRAEYLEPLAGALAGASVVDVSAHGGGQSGGHCRFVAEGAAAISADGSVSPCIALMHSYRYFIREREKSIRRYVVGNIGTEDLPDIWRKSDFRDFRARVQVFDFPACSDCGGCELAETNEADCENNPFPVCGDCLWGKGVIRCP